MDDADCDCSLQMSAHWTMERNFKLSLMRKEKTNVCKREKETKERVETRLFVRRVDPRTLLPASTIE